MENDSNLRTVHDEVVIALHELAAAIRSATSRVVVFPELSLTGYEFDAQAVDPGDPRLVPIIEACRETGASGESACPARICSATC